MTHTPIPTPFPRLDGYIVMCDGCLCLTKSNSLDNIPTGWQKIYITGWIGYFHACSDFCAAKIKKAKEFTGVTRTPILIIK